MTAYVALVRAINLAGHRQVAMADLRALVTRIGFADVRTLLQSGNLVFRGEHRTPAQLERLLETETARRLGLRTEFFVRTAREWQGVVARNPFPEHAARDPGHLLVLALKDRTTPRRVASLRAAITGPEVVQAAGAQLYAFYPDGVGRSRLTIALIERHLATRATGRNWNTVQKLAALVREEES